MRRVGILTDFVGFDPAYSLCQVVDNQIKALTGQGHPTTLFVRPGQWPETHNGARVIQLDPGEIGQNVVNVTGQSEAEIQNLTNQIDEAFDAAGLEVALTHDMVYQANQWKYHVAARRAKWQGAWLHWAHSATPMDVAAQTQRYQLELRGPMPNSWLVVMHPEEAVRKRQAFGYERDRTVIVPNPLDLEEGYAPEAKAVIATMSLWEADVVVVYPCRLDRGKQPDVALEVVEAMRKHGWDARLAIIDFHSTGGDKAVYRAEMKARALERQTPLFFTSDLGGEAGYHVPHKAVMDLLEYGDVLIHPSRSESDPLVLFEAGWRRCGLVLNFDLPVMRQYERWAIMGKFSSAIDALTGLPGSTDTQYADREGYMGSIADRIAYEMRQNPVLAFHAHLRKTRSIQAVGRELSAVIEGVVSCRQ